MPTEWISLTTILIRARASRIEKFLDVADDMVKTVLVGEDILGRAVPTIVMVFPLRDGRWWVVRRKG
ncbi:hypothetical protein EIP91_005567 [Steccherinum ochraceum]|uniref:Uncharacterized protein n=1 Tax=Steccherinum ochraceum TaxID=92696 RepID=A0A4R0RZJ5_9APHY|nr:hypothetical protein EIP91_005567 [Steccherinum ochraceum]